MEKTHLQLLFLPARYNFYKQKSENRFKYEMEKVHLQLLLPPTHYNF